MVGFPAVHFLPSNLPPTRFPHQRRCTSLRADFLTSASDIVAKVSAFLTRSDVYQRQMRQVAGGGTSATVTASCLAGGRGRRRSCVPQDFIVQSTFFPRKFGPIWCGREFTPASRRGLPCELDFELREYTHTAGAPPPCQTGDRSNGSRVYPAPSCLQRSIRYRGFLRWW